VPADDQRWLNIAAGNGEDDLAAFELAESALDRIESAPQGPRRRVFDAQWVRRLAAQFGGEWSYVLANHLRLADYHRCLCTEVMWKQAMARNPLSTSTSSPRAHASQTQAERTRSCAAPSG
jgi:hypothetical protein